MNNLKKIISSLIFLLAASLMFCQEYSGLGDISLSNRIQEDVCIITDRDFYLTGEEIWFITDYTFNDSEKDLSKVAYIELCDHTKSYARKKYKIKDKKISGSIKVPDELVSGIYYLRVYTNFQRNNPPENLNSAMISIINPKIALPAGKNKVQKHIQLLPETDNICAGYPAKVYFQLSKYLHQHHTKIYFIDQHQQVISPPVIYPNGLGFVEFMPNDSSQYTLKVLFNESDSIEENLPEVSKSDLLLFTELNNQSLQIKLTSDSPEDFGVFNLIVRSPGFNIVHEERILFAKKETMTAIDRSLLGEGVNYIFLKNEDNEIIKFRTIYNYPYTHIPLSLSINQTQFNRRELVNLDISSHLPPDQFKQLTVSVVKSGTNFQDNNILPLYFLYNPNTLNNYLYKHTNISKDLQNQIDICMRLYGKRLFDNKMKLFRIGAYENTLNWLPDIRDVSLSGVVRSSISKEPVADVQVLATIFGDHPQLHLNTTKANGEFVFSFNELEKTQKSFFIINDENVNRLELLINNDFSTEYPNIDKIDQSIDTTYKRLIEEMYINAQLLDEFDQIRQESTTTSVRNLPYQYGIPDASILLADYVETPTLEMVFKEIVPYAKVRNKRGEYTLYIYDPVSTQMYRNPLVLLDNVPIFNMNELMSIHPSKIERIDIIKNVYMLGDYAFSGIIFIKTNTNDFAGYTFPSNSIFLDYETVTPYSEVEFPDYSDTDKKESRSADFGNLLYWNPDIVDALESGLTFYTNDHSSSYDIIVRGFTKNGDPCYGRTTIRNK